MSNDFAEFNTVYALCLIADVLTVIVTRIDRIINRIIG